MALLNRFSGSGSLLSGSSAHSLGRNPGTNKTTNTYSRVPRGIEHLRAIGPTIHDAAAFNHPRSYMGGNQPMSDRLHRPMMVRPGESTSDVFRGAFQGSLNRAYGNPPANHVEMDRLGRSWNGIVPAMSFGNAQNVSNGPSK